VQLTGPADDRSTSASEHDWSINDADAYTVHFGDPDFAGFTPPEPPRWSGALSAVIIWSLALIALACPVVVTALLHKQQSVDNAGALISGSNTHAASEFPLWGALSLIPSFTCAVCVYLLFRWITRIPNDEF